MSSPWSMGYSESSMGLSDTLSGFLLIFLSSISLCIDLPQIKWVAASIGLWVTFAPLAFWTSNPAAYSNGNLVGSLIIVSAIVFPSLLQKENQRSPLPLGWTYNPSSWSQRIPIVSLAFLGFLIAKYMAAFQLGHIPTVWDPFFGKGTEIILTSDVSKEFPVSDAGLGAWSYLLDALSGLIGREQRWRTMPWVVILFGLMVIPPGITSITLVILQPVVVGSWCTLCLLTAVIMLLMVPPAIDEVVATVQFLNQNRKQKQSIWRAFWFGSESQQLYPDYDQSSDTIAGSHLSQQGMRKGFPVPWNLGLSAALGIWLMVAPSVFSAQDLASDSNHFFGALIVTFAVIAMAQVARSVRFINIILGAVLAVGIWLVPGGSTEFRWNSLVMSVFLIFLSFPLGAIKDHFGSFDRFVHWSPFRKIKKE